MKPRGKHTDVVRTDGRISPSPHVHHLVPNRVASHTFYALVVCNRLVTFPWTILAVLCTALLIAQGSRATPVAASPQQMAPYLTPQRVVHVGEGRTINLVCLGHGSPTAILAAGLGAWSFWWERVQPLLAKRTRVCSWDRAGYGFSSPSPELQDIVHTTKDLARALKRAGIRGPYVMVGHSMGAYEALRFTDLHRQSVVGMVLVDPAIPDQTAVEERIAPSFATIMRSNAEQTAKEGCAAELRNGTLKHDDPQFERCTSATAVPSLFPSLKAAITRLNADPERLLTQASTEREFVTDDPREVVNTQRHYGDMPLIVLTAGREESSILSALPSGTPAELAHLRKQIELFLRDGWGAGHDAYAALSTRGRNQLVPDSGHNIPVNKPEVVISAINEVLDEIR
jgi:pimeloyl-ACP methyl ester carboxylesterase